MPRNGGWHPSQHRGDIYLNSSVGKSLSALIVLTVENVGNPDIFQISESKKIH